MSPQPAPAHGDMCICYRCEDARKQQYHAHMDHASQRRPITTPPQQIEAALEMSIDFLKVHKAKIAELEKRVNSMTYVIEWACRRPEVFAEFAESRNWAFDFQVSELAALKERADADYEARADS